MSRAAELRAEFLLQLAAEFEDPQDLGDTPLGARRVLHVKRGSFSGPRLSGEILPGGADWVLVRSAAKAVEASEYYFRTALAFETGAEDYRWLNRLIAVGVGTRTAAGMSTDVFAIR